MDTHEILTGEAVALDVNAASFPSRLCAFAIDVALAGIGLGLLWVVVIRVAFATLDLAAMTALGLALSVLMLLIVPWVVETLTRGRSVGKMAAGYRIVRDDGSPIRSREAFVRALVGLVELWASGGFFALVSVAVTKRGKRLGDVLAGTYAVRVRGQGTIPTPIAMPPDLAGWACLTDIGQVDDSLAMQARVFLTRIDQFSPANRARLGLEFATALSQVVAPAPPPGTHPERYIAAVLATRRDRALATANARAATRQALAAAGATFGPNRPSRTLIT